MVSDHKLPWTGMNYHGRPWSYDQELPWSTIFCWITPWLMAMVAYSQQTSTMVCHGWPWSNNQWPWLTMFDHGPAFSDHGWPWTMVDDGIWWTTMVVHFQPSNTMKTRVGHGQDFTWVSMPPLVMYALIVIVVIIIIMICTLFQILFYQSSYFYPSL